MDKQRIYHWAFNCSLLSLCILFLLPGCTGVLPILPVKPATATPLPTVALNALTNSRWQLMALGTTTAARPVLRDSTVTLAFDANGQVHGSGGCSTYMASYRVEEGILHIDEITSTQSACADYRITNQEVQYLAALRSAESFALSGDQLAIWYDDHRGLMSFTAEAALPPATPTNAFPVTLVVPPTPPFAGTPGAPPPAQPLSPTITLAAQPLSPLLPTWTPVAPGIESPLPPTATATPPIVGTPSPTTSATTATPISFAPGLNSMEINGTIAERATNRYLLSAQQSQEITVAISSPNNDLLLSLIGEDGTLLKGAEDGLFLWTGQLPATQDYLIGVVSAGAATTYTLRVTLAPPSIGDAERVEIAPNAPAVARSGNLLEASTKRYVLSASAGQTLTVQSVGYNGLVTFVIRSPSGSSWNGAVQGSDSRALTAQLLLPESGDYGVELSVPAGGTTPYDISFMLAGAVVAGTSTPTTPTPTTPTPTIPPERVEQAPGTTTAERTGQLPDGASNKHYLLGANAGQTLTVDITSVGTPLMVTITSPTGVKWSAEMNPVTDGYAVNYQLPLVETGDYIVALTKADSTPTTSYIARFTVQ